jgi:hypothetical protein
VSNPETSAGEDDPTAETLTILENEIALGRQFGMAGQTLGAMCSARDEIERLKGLITWCRPRLRHEAYRMRLDAAMAGKSPEPDHTAIVHSVNP